MPKLKRRIDRAGYEAILGGIKTPVIVGGSDSDPADEFEPAVNMSFHPTARHPKGEAFLHMRHLDGLRTGRTETETDGEVAHDAGGFKHIFKVVDDKLKWDMDFADAQSVPPSLRFRVRHSLGLSFHKQIIEAGEDSSVFDVPEAEGSYAVYMDRQNNKYQTGKAAHIYSPFFLDAVGARSPLLRMTLVDVEAGVKRLSLIVTPKVQAWLDNPARVGVIRLDPVIGYDTYGSKRTGAGTVTHSTGAYQASVDGSVTQFGVWTTAGGGKCKLGISNASASAPQHVAQGLSFLGQGEILSTVGSVVNPNYVSPDAEILLVKDSWYKVWVREFANFNIRYDTLAIYKERYVGTYASEFPSIVPTTTQNVPNTIGFSIWAEYDEVVAGVTILDYMRGLGRGVSRGISRGLHRIIDIIDGIRRIPWTLTE